MGAILDAILGPVVALARRIPMWAWLLALVLLWGTWQRHLANSKAEELRKHDAAIAAQTVQKLQADAAESGRRMKEQTNAVAEAEARARAAHNDAAGQRAAADRLRARLAAGTANGRPADPAASGASAPAGDAACVPANLFWRAVEAAGQYAGIADARGTAGQACQQSYEALTPKP